MKKENLNYFINLIIPAFIFGSITGIFTSLAVLLFKFCAKYVIGFSEYAYHGIKEHLYLLPVAFALLFVISVLLVFIYKKIPNIKGGGIPTSIGILRGLIGFKWLGTLIGTFFVSLTTFLIGVPLGNEGPSVQIGTSIGKEALLPFQKSTRLGADTL